MAPSAALPICSRGRLNAAALIEVPASVRQIQVVRGPPLHCPLWRGATARCRGRSSERRGVGVDKIPVGPPLRLWHCGAHWTLALLRAPFRLAAFERHSVYQARSQSYGCANKAAWDTGQQPALLISMHSQHVHSSAAAAALLSRLAARQCVRGSLSPDP